MPDELQPTKAVDAYERFDAKILSLPNGIAEITIIHRGVEIIRTFSEGMGPMLDAARDLIAHPEKMVSSLDSEVAGRESVVAVLKRGADSPNGTTEE